MTQANLSTTICSSGYTRTVRPPASYTDQLKLSQMRDYGRRGPVSAYEEDHLVALELGGHPTDPRNLWPESRKNAPEAVQGLTAETKDQVENATNRAVCSGTLTLAEAQAAMAGDWVALGRRLGAI